MRVDAFIGVSPQPLAPINVRRVRKEKSMRLLFVVSPCETTNSKNVLNQTCDEEMDLTAQRED